MQACSLCISVMIQPERTGTSRYESGSSAWTLTPTRPDIQPQTSAASSDYWGHLSCELFPPPNSFWRSCLCLCRNVTYSIMGNLSRWKCVCRSLRTRGPVVCFRGVLPNQGPNFNGLARQNCGEEWRCWSKHEEKLSNHSSASKAASAEQHGSAWPLLRRQQVALQAARCCSPQMLAGGPSQVLREISRLSSGVERLLLLPAVVVHKAGRNPFCGSALTGYISAVWCSSGTFWRVTQAADTMLPQDLTAGRKIH